MKVDYIRMMQEYFGIRNEGFLTDNPMSIKLSDDDYIKVRYDAKAMRWIANHKTLRRWCTQTIEDYLSKGKAIDRTVSQRVCGEIEISRRAGIDKEIEE